MRGPWWQKRLYDFGYRLTSPRQIIINILRNTDKHLSAEDIYIDAIKTNPSIGLTTVYRTLDLFSQIGVVQKFDFGEGRARYELTNNPLKKDHHHHLVCVNCKSIIDYTDFVNEELELMNKTEKALSEKYQFNIFHHTINFYGMCSKCRIKE
ncbi:transcriptional repressor [candidate division KSB1 bacterium]|nr:transcriptional repressor [candidate division KSB1 bacterium]